ncbi:MAG: type II toxin-antitoxin system VapC family toxin [Terriglobia bacterium]
MDSSVWIDFFRKAPGPAGHELRRLIAESEPLALSGIIVTEVLQGIGRDIEWIEHHLSLWDLVEPEGFKTYMNAASLSRFARSRGVTLTTIDALIATLALERGAVLFTLEQDFSHVADFTGLRIHSRDGDPFSKRAH